MASGCLFLVLLLLLEFSVASKGADKRRCCKHGETLTFDGGSDPAYFCRTALPTAPELWGRSLNDSEESLPDCQDGSSLESISLTAPNLPSTDDSSCFDVLINETEVLEKKTGRDNRTYYRQDPVRLYCSPVLDGEKRSSRKESFSLFKINRCCPQNEIFELGDRACRAAEEPESSSRSIAPPMIPPSVDRSYYFIHTVRDSLMCDKEEVLVQREVNPTDISFESDGRLQFQANVSFEVEKACLEFGSESGPLLVLRTCQSIEYCERNPCIKKCCPEGEMLYNNDNRCRFTPDNFTITKWHREIVNLSKMLEHRAEMETSQTSDYGMSVGKPFPSHFIVHPSDNWRLSTNWKIYNPLFNFTKTFRYNETCIDLRTDDDQADEIELVALIYKSDEDEGSSLPVSEVRRRVNVVFMWISCVFLFATFAIYAYLPELQNLHGKTVMAHVGSMLMGYSFFPILPFVHGTSYCEFIAFAVYFFMLSVFLWLNLFCFDIWWKFGSISRSSQSNISNRRKDEKKRFLMYCLIAWGLAFLLTIFALLSDRLEVFPDHWRPGFGIDKCWFAALNIDNQRRYGEVLYFIGPVSVLLLLNIIFYASTAWRCNAIKAKLAKVQTDRSSDANRRRFESEKTKFVLNVKLFVVMGISWVFEVASFLVGFYAPNHQIWIFEAVFYVADIFNALQGLLIFVIFILKRRVFNLLKDRCGRRGASRSSTGNFSDTFRNRRSTTTSSSTVFSASTVNPQS